MSYFDTLLSKPLPSVSRGEDDIFAESDDDKFEKELDSQMKSDFKEDESGDAFEDSLDDFGDDYDPGFDDLDDDIDAELDELDAEVSGPDDDYDDLDDDIEDYDGIEDECGDECGTECGDECGTEGVADGLPLSVNDPTPAAQLVGVADAEADRMMAICATPAMMDSAMNEDALEEFVENGEADIAVNEGFLLESDVSDIYGQLASDDTFEEATFAPEGKKFKMTKSARFKQLYELSLQIEARAHKDPYYAKLQKAYAIERKIKAGWRQRYHALAVRRAKRYLKNLMKSKSGALRKIGHKLSGR